MNPTDIEIIATVLFACAIVHTFLIKRFETIATRFPKGSVGENVFHLLGEVEIAVFGFWAMIFLGILAGTQGWDSSIAYLEGRYVPPGATQAVSINFTEPLFVFAIMAMAATLPILEVARRIIERVSRLVPGSPDVGFYVSALIVGPLLGSFITEPAAMTVTALLLKRRFFDRGMRPLLMYATLGLLFVNVSIGGTLTNFAAPPVVMVAATWDLDIMYMMTHFGWKAALAVLVSTIAVTLYFRKQLANLPPMPAEDPATAKMKIPVWLMVVHLVLIAAVVATSHHIAAFMGIFLFFLGISQVTKEYQDDIKVREALLVGYFLMGLVLLGGLQTWWLQPTLAGMSELPMFFGAAGLTGVTDNAALTFLGSQVHGLSEMSQYALLAGAVTGGGLTVIANAPNPAGFGILKSSFGETGISPLWLFVSALPATLVATAAFLLLPNL